MSRGGLYVSFPQLPRKKLMNTKKKTIQKILDKRFPDEMDSSMYHPNLPEAIAEIQALCKGAIPSMGKVYPCNNCDNPNQMRDKRCTNCEAIRGRNGTLEYITTALVERGLLKGEEE